MLVRSHCANHTHLILSRCIHHVTQVTLQIKWSIFRAIGARIHIRRNDLRNWAPLENGVQDIVGDFKYLEGCHIKGLDPVYETLWGITSFMD